MICKITKILRWFISKRSYKWIVRDWIKIDDLDLCAKVLSTDRFRKNLETLLVEPPGNGKKIVVIAPHQDDETIGAGGTLLKAAKNGAKVTCIFVTDGALAAGESLKNEMVRIREEEAKNVWDKIGGSACFMRFPDGGTPLTEEAAAALIKKINEFNPDIIFIPFLLDDHPAHRRTNHLLWLAKDKINNSKIEVWSYQVWSGLIPNIAVDISDIIDQKSEINRLWESQIALRDFVHLSNGLAAYNSKFINTNKAAYLEIFFNVPFHEYMDLCSIYFNNPLEKIYTDYQRWIEISQKTRSL